MKDEGVVPRSGRIAVVLVGRESNAPDRSAVSYLRRLSVLARALFAISPARSLHPSSFSFPQHAEARRKRRKTQTSAISASPRDLLAFSAFQPFSLLPYVWVLRKVRAPAPPLLHRGS